MGQAVENLLGGHDRDLLSGSGLAYPATEEWSRLRFC
jgi:hypothetical protein